MNIFSLYFYKIFKSSNTFELQGNNYTYFCHKYNITWKNERAVEVPIIWEEIKKYSGKKILEVGNVLSHYLPINHKVLDKYEKAEGVVNQEVISFRPPEKYDLIVSISTLEHVGWDESPKDPMKIIRAIENLTNCLAAKGKMVATLPLGYNTEMDKLLDQDKLPFTKQYYLKRISKDNKWQEVDWQNISDARYGYPFPNANGLVIGIVER